MLLAQPADKGDDWHQAIVGFQRDTLLMAALRAAILLDRDETMVSFQAVYHRLKEPSVKAGLLQALEGRYGSKHFSPSRTELIEEFLQTYREIDWEVHGRLVHFRNRGIAHLTLKKLLKSVTLEELKTIVGIVCRLATTLRDLCQSRIAFHADALDEYRDLAKKAISKRSGDA
jgi:hypothetical protein